MNQLFIVLFILLIMYFLFAVVPLQVFFGLRPQSDKYCTKEFKDEVSVPEWLVKQRNTQLKGKTYVVTGASSGIGQGISLKLGSMGANVVICARRVDLLNSVVEAIKQLGGQGVAVQCDVTNNDDIKRLGDTAINTFGNIDVWINNAGLGVVGRFWDAPVEDYSRIIDVNLKGVVYGSHYAINQFLKSSGKKVLINVGSIASEIPLNNLGVYSGTKAAILSMDRAINEELRLIGKDTEIRVLTVMPWSTNTPWRKHAANYSGNELNGGDDANKVIDDVVWASINPWSIREELPSGWKAILSYFSHKLYPNITERVAADLTHRQKSKTKRPNSDGALFEPIDEGRTVCGGPE